MIKKIKSKELIIEATCDKCGADCLKPLYSPLKSDGDRDNKDIYKEFEGMKLEANWGYNSKKDDETWEAILCENCVDEFLVPFIDFVKTLHD